MENCVVNECLGLNFGDTEIIKLMNQWEDEDGSRESEAKLGEEEEEAEIEALKLSERLQEKLCEELADVEEKLMLTETSLEYKNLEIKKMDDERKTSFSAQLEVEDILQRVLAALKDDRTPPIEAILSPLKEELKFARQEIAKLQDETIALDFLNKCKQTELLKAERTSLAKDSITEYLQKENNELMKQIKTCQEENKILDKMHSEKVVELEKTKRIATELKNTIRSSTTYKAMKHYQQKVQEMEERERAKTISKERENASGSKATRSSWTGKTDSQYLQNISRGKTCNRSLNTSSSPAYSQHTPSRNAKKGEANESFTIDSENALVGLDGMQEDDNPSLAEKDGTTPTEMLKDRVTMTKTTTSRNGESAKAESLSRYNLQPKTRVLLKLPSQKLHDSNSYPSSSVPTKTVKTAKPAVQKLSTTTLQKLPSTKRTLTTLRKFSSTKKPAPILQRWMS